MNLLSTLGAGFAVVWRCSWQAAIIVVLILLSQRLLRRWISPHWKSALWFLLLIRLAVPVTPQSTWSVYNIVIGLLENPLGAVERSTPKLESPTMVQNPDRDIHRLRFPEPGAASVVPSPTGLRIDWSAWLGLVWLLGAVLSLLRLAGGLLTLRRCLRCARPLTDPAATQPLLECSRRLSLRRPPRLLEIEGIESPALAGWISPKLLLPIGTRCSFCEEELRHIFLHELSHVRRRDALWNGLAALFQALHWFNPLVRIGLNRMRADQELATDAMVLSCMPLGANRSYGLTLLRLLEQFVRFPTTPGLVRVVDNPNQMRGRIELIASFSLTRTNPLPALGAVAVIALAGLTDAQLPADQVTHVSGPTFSPAAAAAVAASHAKTLETRELLIDRSHLLTIHQAIRAYFKDHRTLPDWLSDLVPRYLPDPAVLISPTERRTAQTNLFGRVDPKIHTSYVYDFNAGPAPEEFNKDRAAPITCREWKRMQLEKFGLVTPILRCHLHQRVLNVAYSGDFYETGLLWEDDPQTQALTKRKPELGPPAAISSAQLLPVRLVDPSSGNPIPGGVVHVEVGSEFGLLPPQELVSDENGRCQFPLGEWKLNWVSVKASRPGGKALGFHWNRNDDASTPAAFVIPLPAQPSAENSLSAPRSP